METIDIDTRRMEADKNLIAKFLDQAPGLPNQVAKEMKNKFPGEKIVLYAFVDLDERYRLSEAWLILTTNKVLVANRASGEIIWEVEDRDQIASLRDESGLSCNQLVLLGKSHQALIVVRYSHRQSRGVGLFKFSLEQSLGENLNKSQSQHQGPPVDPHKLYRDQVIQPLKEAQASVAGGQMAVVWRLFSYLKPYRRQVMAGMFGAAGMTALALVPPFLTGRIIDEVIWPFEAGTMSKQAAWQIGLMVIIGLVGVNLFREAFAWVRLRTMSILGEKVAQDLRDQVYRHLHSLSLGYFSGKQTGSLISRVGSDTDRIWDFVAFGVVEVTTSILILLGLSGVLLYLDPELGLLVSVPVPLLLWAIYKHGQKMQHLFLRAWRKWSQLTDCVSDAVPGIRVVKAFNRQAYEVNRFSDRNRSVVDEFNSIHKTWTSFWPFMMLSIHAIVVAVWLLGLPRILDGELSAGVFVSFVLYLTMFMQPIEVIGQMARMVNRATSSAHRVFEVLDTEPQIIDVKNPKQLNPLEGHLKFENVSFSYDGVRKILKGISLDIRPGEMIGLVGPSGSGKTTLINLIARFYEVTDGRMLVDGVDLNELDVGHYRGQLGMVLQDPYLFHGTILDNIRYAKPEASVAQVIRASQAANAHDFVSGFPQGYDTVVGERGHTLSGGERQRISIARAILRDPRLLILDEATSSVDTETEKKIQEALDRLVKGRTVIAIAHRLSTLAKADRLVVLKKGQIVETGHHRELMEVPGGVYAKLVKVQSELHGV